MKKVLRVLAIALITAAFAGVSFAADKTSAEKPKTMTVSGEITAVDAKAGTVTVKTKDKDVNLNASSSKAKTALGKVKPGDMIKVTYTEQDGKMNATSVSVVKKTSDTAKTDTTKTK